MLVCVFSCAFCTRDRGCSAPGFPCALLLFQRVAIDAKLGRIAPRECERASSRCLTIEPETGAMIPVSLRLSEPRTHFTSPACGGGRGARRARRVGELPPREQCESRRYPPPDPPPDRESARLHSSHE